MVQRNTNLSAYEVSLPLARKLHALAAAAAVLSPGVSVVEMSLPPL